jgi:hypothetical protein
MVMLFGFPMRYMALKRSSNRGLEKSKMTSGQDGQATMGKGWWVLGKIRGTFADLGRTVYWLTVQSENCMAPEREGLK